MAAKPHPLVLTPLPGDERSGPGGRAGPVELRCPRQPGTVAAAYDLSIVQARLLGILRDRRPTIKELARFLGLDKSSVTGLVDRAEDRGLVHRTPSRNDGRSVQVVITAAGRKLIARAASAFEAETAVLVADLDSAQRERLSAAASRIVVAEAADGAGLTCSAPRRER